MQGAGQSPRNAHGRRATVVKWAPDLDDAIAMDGGNSSVTGSSDDGGGSASPPTRTWVRKSAAAEMIAVDDSIVRMLGWAPEDLLGKTSLEFIHPDDQGLAVENWMQMLSSPGPSAPLRFRHLHRDGSWRWVEMTNHNFLDDPSHACVVAELLDISDEPMVGETLARERTQPTTGEGRPLQLHEALRAREQLIHRLSEALPVGVLHVDVKGRVLYTNRRLHAILDRERASTFLDQLSTVVSEDMPIVEEAFDAALKGGLDSDIEVRLASAEDREIKERRQCTLSVRTLSNDAGEPIGAVACLVDITESVRMRDELRLQATFDILTTCHNRASTMEALGKMLTEAPATRGPAVIFVDLDDFKSINDHLGHAAGDEMLEVVARRLQGAVRGGDIVGRIGGDEFLVLCPDIASSAEALRAAARVTESLRWPVKLQGAEVSCRASVGVAWSVAGDIYPDTLIGQADAAMYQAKRSDLGQPVLYRHAD